MDIYYLYLKTHCITGLKYLGKTTSKNPHRYKGSGVYWRNHLKMHGSNYTTEIIRECHTIEELKEWGLYYSELWDIVNAKDDNGKKLWANTKPESGDGGSIKGHKKSDTTKEKHRNKIWTEKAIQNRLNNCLSSAAKRKGVKNPDHGQKLFLTYVVKNENIIKQVWELFENGLNRRQIALTLNISWDRVNMAINKKEHILKALGK
jgi:hypothetical protein